MMLEVRRESLMICSISSFPDQRDLAVYLTPGKSNVCCLSKRVDESQRMRFVEYCICCWDPKKGSSFHSCSLSHSPRERDGNNLARKISHKKLETLWRVTAKHHYFLSRITVSWHSGHSAKNESAGGL